MARAAPTEGIAGEQFEDLVRQHQRRVYRIVLSLVRDADAADTLTQECFLRAYEKRASFRGECGPGTWLMRIALNLARDHVRNRRAGFWRRMFHLCVAAETGCELVAENVADPHASPERSLLAREELAAVWSAVDQLSPQQRTIFLLRFAEQMSLAEIAQAMELEIGTVKAHLFRAVATVRKRTKESNR
jgi:RNA polymerase sigma-70 factor (ECF subfamily)